MKDQKEKVKELDGEESTQGLPQNGECGSMPARPGGTTPGDWECQNGSWVWVENIGG